MPRLCAATTGIWPMKARASSEKTKTVTRQRPTMRSARAVATPAHRSRQCPAGRADLGQGGQRDGHEGGDDEQVGHGVPGEDPGRTDEVVGHAADDGADDPRGVHLGRVEGDGAGHVLAPDQSGEDGRVGRGVQGVAHADHDHHHHQEDVGGGGGPDDQRHPQGEHQLFDGEHDEELLAVDLVGQQAAQGGQDERRAELGEDDHPDERARVRRVVGVGAQDDVLHPGADVGGEGAEEHDPERAVPQGRGRRAGGDGAVPVDDGVLNLLERDGAQALVPSRPRRHPRMVRDRAPAAPRATDGVDAIS